MQLAEIEWLKCHLRQFHVPRMHQYRWRLGLRPRPHWGSLQRSPRPPSWITGVLLLRGGEEEGRGGPQAKAWPQHHFPGTGAAVGLCCTVLLQSCFVIKGLVWMST